MTSEDYPDNVIATVAFKRPKLIIVAAMSCI